MAVVRSHAGNRVGYTNVPEEGPLSVGFYLNFASNSSYYFNILDFTSKGEGYAGLTSIQALWIDNSQNASEATIYVTQTNQTLYITASSQGYYPILSPDKGTITISAPTSSVIQLSFLNFLVDQAQWFPSGVNTNIVGVVNVNVEGMTFTGGYLNTLDATLASIKGSEISANALPVYQVNNPTSISVTGQTYTGNNLNTEDATIASIKGSTSAANSLPVYLSGNYQKNSYFYASYAPGTSDLEIIAPTNVGLLINTIYITFGVPAYYSGGVAQSITLLDGSNNQIFSQNCFLPTSSPVASSSQFYNSPVICNLNNINIYVSGGLYLTYVGTLTAGSLHVNIFYQQI